jgi:hypothetical protein
MKFRLSSTAALAVILSGCISFSGLDPKSDYSDVGDEAIIVLGVSPRYRVHISKGDRVADKWNRDQIMTKLNVFPEDGYVVAKLPARSGTSNYGVAGILPEGIGGKLFMPCQGKRTLTFDAPRGKVVYVGEIKFVEDGSNFHYEVSSNFEAARAYLKARYPLLADKLVSGGFENPELANTRCVRDAGPPIIIYLPVRR